MSMGDTSEIPQRFPPESFEVVCSTPEEFARTIDAEVARYGDIIRKANIRADAL